jgi:hypothetical protein
MRDPVELDALVAAVTLESHGKGYALALRPEGGLDVFRVEGGTASQFGMATSREAALRMVDDHASGRSQERAERFSRWLGETVGAVRETVSGPLLAAGYEAWHMGGGCMSWGRNLADGTHVLICTEDNLVDGDPAADAWIVGRYGKEEGFVLVQKPSSLEAAIDAADRLPFPAGPGGETVEVCADSVEEVAEALEAIRPAPGR